MVQVSSLDGIYYNIHIGFYGRMKIYDFLLGKLIDEKNKEDAKFSILIQFASVRSLSKPNDKFYKKQKLKVVWTGRKSGRFRFHAVFEYSLKSHYSFGVSFFFSVLPFSRVVGSGVGSMNLDMGEGQLIYDNQKTAFRLGYFDWAWQPFRSAELL